MSSILNDGPTVDAITSLSRANVELAFSGKALECRDSFYFTDEDFYFTPTAHPRRELFTASLFVLVILTFVVWGGWTLISL
jgi:hypothetical protein